MSDMIPGGMPPQGRGGMPPQPPQGDPEEAMRSVEDNRSLLNPTDGAMMKQQGQLSPNMTVGMFIENTFGVKWEDPVQKLIQASSKQLQNRTALGKSQNMAKDSGPGPGGMPGRPPMVGRGAPPQGGQGNPMADIMSQLGG